MLNAIAENIKGFFDLTIFFTMLGIGAFVILVDFSYFKKLRYIKDAAISLVIAVSYIVLAFVFLIVMMV